MMNFVEIKCYNGERSVVNIDKIEQLLFCSDGGGQVILESGEKLLVDTDEYECLKTRLLPNPAFASPTPIQELSDAVSKSKVGDTPADLKHTITCSS
tara:strand:+ start:2039 stop:2329 length:291 start_codon:yes stop_codon:yes gene_type:complete